MSCAIHLALLESNDKREIDKLFRDACSIDECRICLAIGYRLGGFICDTTSGCDFVTRDGRHFDNLDLYGEMLLPIDTVKRLHAVLVKFRDGECEFPCDIIYDPEDDDGDGSFFEQVQKLIALTEEAINKNCYLVSFGV